MVTALCRPQCVKDENIAYHQYVNTSFVSVLLELARWTQVI